MKLFNYIKIAALGLVLAAAASCGPKEVLRSSVLPEETNLTFAAVNAPAQTMNVYAEGDWVANVSVDWLTVSPMYGTGNTEVTITVTDNVKDGAQDSPRNTAIYFTCDAKERGGQTNVYQKGDTYLGLPEITTSEIGEYADDDMLKIPSSQVMALTTTGMIISDGTSNLLVQGVGEGVKVGDQIFINGKKATANDFPCFVLDECEILSNGTPAYPTAKNISGEMGTYDATTYEYISVAGSIVGLVQDNLLIGAAVRVPGATTRIMVATSPAEMEMAAANYHKVEIAGYYTGKSGSNLSFIPAVVTVGELDESVVPVPAEPGTVLFEDNFDWMDPFVAEATAAGVAIGRSVEENNASGSAPNLYTTAGLENLRAEFEKRYVDINAACTSIYPQNTYWKFGKTNNHTGIQLPSIDYYGELEMSFDWSPHMTGSGNIDKTILIVEVITAGTSVTAAEYSYESWEKGKLAWKHVTARINITPESQVRVRPISLEDYNGITQQRWYIDNIKIGVPGPDVEPIYANVTVDKDLLTYEGQGGDVALKVSSDYDFAVTTDAEWLTVSPAEGAANEEVAVTVTAAASELSTLRQAKVIITSEETTREIRVVQSAAGQDLDALLSISKSSVKLLSDGGKVSVRVQSNVDYKVEISDPWVSQIETKAQVEKDDYTFEVAANEEESERTATVTFSAGDLRAVLTISQGAASKYEILFKDDFSWLDPFIADFNSTATKKISDYVGGTYESLADRVTNLHQAPNVYSDTHFGTAFLEAFANAGYEDLNASAKVMYPQDAYLKFGKNNNSGGIAINAFKNFTGKSADVIFNFDWSVHMTGSFVVDVVTMKLYIDGDGTFANGTKESDDMTIGMTDGNDPFWKNESVEIFGVTKDTKIQMISKQGHESLTTSGQHRWYVDNIRVEKVGETVFSDDFSWLKPLIDEYNEANPTKPIGNSVEGHDKSEYAAASSANAPNAYTAEPFKSKFPAALAEAGYTDLNASAKVLYPQDTYIKLGKTSAHTSLQFAPFAGQDGAANYTLSFDWCRHVQGSATIDPVKLIAVIEGEGTFANGTKYSDPVSTNQQYVVKDDTAGEPGWAEMFWTNSSIKIVGATATTKINIVYSDCLDQSTGTYNWTVSGAHRYHIDNIKVVKN